MLNYTRAQNKFLIVLRVVYIFSSLPEISSIQTSIHHTGNKVASIHKARRNDASFFRRNHHVDIGRSTGSTSHHIMRLSSSKDDQSESVCKSITSQEAADLIKFYYEKKLGEIDESGSNKDNNSLLVITSDASRGSNRYTGFACILRQIGILSFPAMTQQLGNASTTGDQSVHDCLEKSSSEAMDKVMIVTRRMQSISSKNIARSEIHSTILGMKSAFENIPIRDRQHILIITDSSSSISFFSHEKFHHRKKQAQYQHEYKILQNLLQDQENRDTSSFIYIAKVKSAHRKENGFFDHEVCDILSKDAVRKPNKDSLFQNCDPILAPVLGEADLNYLEFSSSFEPGLPLSSTQENKLSPKDWPIKQTRVQINKANSERLQRCNKRMKQELGINDLSSSVTNK